jgi:hypothetical protein
MTREYRTQMKPVAARAVVGCGEGVMCEQGKGSKGRRELSGFGKDAGFVHAIESLRGPKRLPFFSYSLLDQQPPIVFPAPPPTASPAHRLHSWPRPISELKRRKRTAEEEDGPRFPGTETFSAGLDISLTPATTSAHLARGAQKKIVL